MSMATDVPRYKLVFTVPHSSLEQCKTAIFAKGAGSHPGGKYSLVCFETPGESQFMPAEGSHPAIGKVGQIERVKEMRVETLCVGQDVMRAAVKALRNAHPYEEAAYEVYKLENV